MRVNRRFLYWGVFLVALGGVLIAVDLANPDGSAIAGALRFWPLAIISVGLGLVLRRTRLAVAGGMLAAAVPGLVLGGAFAVAPRITVDCGASSAPSATTTREGTFDGSARIDISTGCGVLVVDTAAGSSWRFDGGDSATRSPVVDATSRSLSIDAGGGHDWQVFDRTHDTWHLALPTSPIDDLTLTVNAGTGRLSLAGAQISRLALTTNAASTTVDLGDATVSRISGEVNAGAESIRLSATADLVASFDVNAGSLEICAPAGLGLLVRHDGTLSGIRINGADQGGRTWQSADYASAPHHADITITANLGSAEINPIGGCK
jgi:hypothetical protein